MFWNKYLAKLDLAYEELTVNMKCFEIVLIFDLQLSKVLLTVNMICFYIFFIIILLIQ